MSQNNQSAVSGLGYDLRSCGRCGALYDQDTAEWDETKCGDCHGKADKERLSHTTVPSEAL